MPAGKPGDHPRTDIVIHGLQIFGPGVDELIRSADELDTLGPIANEWLWNRGWEWKEVQRSGRGNERERFLQSMERTLLAELDRKRPPAEPH